VVIDEPQYPGGAMCNGWGSDAAEAAAAALARFARGVEPTPPSGWEACLRAGHCQEGILELLANLGPNMRFRSSLTCLPAPTFATILGPPGQSCGDPFAFVTANSRGITSAQLSNSEPLTADVPSVLSLTKSEAVERLENDGFSVRVDGANDPTCDLPDLVLRQQPGTSRPVYLGGMVTVYVNRQNDPNC
jgi:hypothetical protein